MCIRDSPICDVNVLDRGSPNNDSSESVSIRFCRRVILGISPALTGHFLRGSFWLGVDKMCIRDSNKGVVKESVANLVSGFADDLMSAPFIDPETLRPMASCTPHHTESVCSTTPP